MVKVTFHGEKEIEEDNLDLSLLDISLKHDIPHLHVCGRVGKCSTCRVMILEHPENVLPRNPIEQRCAEEQGLQDDVRLACQTQIRGPVTLLRKVKDNRDVDMVTEESFQFGGSELPLAIMFTDIRDFTPFTERQLPYDVLHILDRYYFTLGETVIRNRGYVHQYYGDGMLSLFGFYARNPAQICMDAVTAALEMLDALREFNLYLKTHFNEEFRTATGIHFGEVIAGKFGHPKHRQLNVLGDVVNTASRLESAAKASNVSLTISDAVFWHLGSTVLDVKPVKINLKGKSGLQKLYEVRGFAKGYRKQAYGIV